MRITTAALASELKSDLAMIGQDLGHVKKTTDEMHKAVYGNGDPRQGLAGRVGVLETISERLERLVWLIAGAAVSGMVAAVIAILRTGP